MENLRNCILLRASKKTGKVDTTLTAIGSGLLSVWALKNCTKSKMILIIDSDTGEVIYFMQGNPNSDFPQVKSLKKDGDLGFCEEYGIPLSMIKSIAESEE